MKKKKGLIIFAVVLLAVLISLYFDSEIVRGAYLIRNVFLTNLFLGITFASSWVVILLILTLLFLSKDDKRRWVLPLWITLATSTLVNLILKIAMQRQRPFQLGGLVSTLPLLAKNSHLAWNSSFPSFHAMLGFCVLPFISKEFPKLRYIWIVFASLIALSRVYFGLHFLSDVIAGAFIGYLIGALIVKKETEDKFWDKTYKKLKKLVKKI